MIYDVEQERVHINEVMWEASGEGSVLSWRDRGVVVVWNSL